MEREHLKYQRLIDFCATLPPTTVAVVHPCDETSLAGAMEAAKLKLIAPTLVGPLADPRCGNDAQAMGPFTNGGTAPAFSTLPGFSCSSSRASAGLAARASSNRFMVQALPRVEASAFSTRSGLIGSSRTRTPMAL